MNISSANADSLLSISSKTNSFLQKICRFFTDPAMFRLVFFVVLYCDIRYLNIPLYYTVLSVMAVWALGLIIQQFCIKRRMFRVKFRRILFIFMFFAFVSVLLHGEINLIPNLFTLYWMAVCFLLFYGIHSEKSNRQVQKEMKRLFNVLTVMTDLTMLLGLVLFVIFPKGFSLMGFDFCIIEGRFVGIIPNANVTAFYSVMCIVMCAVLLRMYRAEGGLTRFRRIFYIVSIVINVITLIMTDSNASMVFVMAFLSFLCFYELFKEFTLKKLHTIVFRLAATFLSCVVIVSSLLFVRINVQNGIAAMLSPRQPDILISTSLDANNDNIKLDKTELSKKPANAEKVIGHQNSNIDSGRFVLWRQALGLIELYPLFGIGKDNIPDYGVDYLGGIRYTNLGGNKYVDFHNGLLTITVSFGLVGLSLFMVFAITVAKAIFKSMFRHKVRSRRDGNVLVILAAFCVGYCVYSMFEAALLVDCTYRVFIFWVILGFALSYVMKYHQQGIHSKIEPEPAIDDSSELEYIRSKFIQGSGAKHVYAGAGSAGKSGSGFDSKDDNKPGNADKPDNADNADNADDADDADDGGKTGTNRKGKKSKKNGKDRSRS